MCYWVTQLVSSGGGDLTPAQACRPKTLRSSLYVADMPEECVLAHAACKMREHSLVHALYEHCLQQEQSVPTWSAVISSSGKRHMMELKLRQSGSAAALQALWPEEGHSQGAAVHDSL